MLGKLIQMQREAGESDGTFARRLGIPRTTWVVTRLGQKPIGRRVAQAVARTFPELRDEAVAILLGEASTSEVA